MNDPGWDLPAEPEAVVDLLYRAVLGRAAEPAGLAHWGGFLRGGSGVQAMLGALLRSPEYAVKRPRAPDPARAAAALRAAVGRPVVVVDLGAQDLDGEEHVYEGLRRTLPHRVIGFEPLLERVQARETREGLGSLELHPHAIADGGEHVLHVNDPDATSSLLPLDPAVFGAHHGLRDIRTVSRRPVPTRRLDDVLAGEAAVDFLKLDIQGAELLALRGAERLLARTACVHCEVQFTPLYAGSPPYESVAAFLVERGFALIDFVDLTRYAPVAPSGHESPDRLLWADAVFFRHDPDDAALAAIQAAVALLVYGKPALAEALAVRHDALRPGAGLAEALAPLP